MGKWQGAAGTKKSDEWRTVRLGFTLSPTPDIPEKSHDDSYTNPETLKISS